MKRNGILFIGGLLVSLFLLGGCQSDIALSKAVRKGDTVVVSLGDANPNGQYTNINSPLIRESDITANMVDQNFVSHPVKVRHVFRVYGDPTAVSGDVRGQAQWMAAIDLVNPVSNAKPNLAIGHGALLLESSKFKEPHVIKTQIIQGSGSPHPFISQNEPMPLGLDKMEFVKPAKQALVTVGGTLPQGVKLAGAEYRFEVPAVHTTDLLGQRMEAVAPAKLPATQQIYFEFQRIERQAPAATDVIVAITSTEGVDQANLSDFDFVLTSEQDAIFNNPHYWGSKLTSATFYDTDGQEIAGLMGFIGQNM